MKVSIFLFILTICAAGTSIVTEAIKRFLDELKVKYVTNILVLIVAMVIGCGATALYYINTQIPFNILNSVYLVLMGVANWIGAMVGYDKVKQTIAQISNKG